MRWIGLIVLAACGGSQVSSLVKQGKYSDACEATDFEYSRVLVDALVEHSTATIAITPMRPADVLAAAKVTTPPHDDRWIALALALDYSTGPITQVTIEDPDVRAEGWQARGAMGVGDSYKLLTGKSPPPRGHAMSAEDLAVGVKGVVTNNADDKARLSNPLSSDAEPDDMPAAEAFAAQFGTSCSAIPSAQCRVARFIAAEPRHVTKPTAIAFTIKYAVANAAGAHCTQGEHIVVPLAAGADLGQQIAATFPSPMRLADLRARARVYATSASDPFWEDDRR